MSYHYAPNFEEETIEDERFLNTEIKINPDFYIHLALVNSQKCLLSENMKEGFMQYWTYIGLIEIFCRSASIIPDDYDEEIKEYEDSLKDMKDDWKKDLRIVNKKLYLLMKEVFNAKPVIAPLKVVDGQQEVNRLKKVVKKELKQQMGYIDETEENEEKRPLETETETEIEEETDQGVEEKENT